MLEVPIELSTEQMKTIDGARKLRSTIFLCCHSAVVTIVNSCKSKQQPAMIKIWSATSAQSSSYLGQKSHKKKSPHNVSFARTYCIALLIQLDKSIARHTSAQESYWNATIKEPT